MFDWRLGFGVEDWDCMFEMGDFPFLDELCEGKALKGRYLLEVSAAFGEFLSSLLQDNKKTYTSNFAHQISMVFGTRFLQNLQNNCGVIITFWVELGRFQDVGLTTAVYLLADGDFLGQPYYCSYTHITCFRAGQFDNLLLAMLSRGIHCVGLERGTGSSSLGKTTCAIVYGEVGWEYFICREAQVGSNVLRVHNLCKNTKRGIR